MNINDTVVFKSRYNQDRIVTKISENEYTLEGTSYFSRGGFTNSGAKFFDLEGGPMMCVGDKISFLEVDDKRRVIDFSGIDTDKQDYVIMKLTVG
jgi:hypothetical protein